MTKRTLLTSLACAWKGVWYALKTQRNMRLHLVLGVAAVVAAGWLAVNPTEWLLLSCTVTLVLVAELLNTAVEVLVDVLSKGRSTEARIIKDLAAGAVLFCSINAVVVGCVVFCPRLVDWIRSVL